MFFTSIEWIGLVACILIVIIAYFLGNISPSILIGRMYGVDIKKEGSGNAGTTNVLRVLGKKAAVATLLIDVFKGVFAVLLGRLVGVYFLAPEIANYMAMLCGLAAFCGHIWPLAFEFKGGKGVATAFGVIMAVSPVMGVAVLFIVLVTVVISRRVSLGSVVAAISFPLIAYFYNPDYLIWGTIMSLIILYKHKSNIERLIKGQEPKINFKK